MRQGGDRMPVDVAYELLAKGCASLYRDVQLCLV